MRISFFPAIHLIVFYPQIPQINADFWRHVLPLRVNSRCLLRPLRLIRPGLFAGVCAQGDGFEVYGYFFAGGAVLEARLDFDS